MIANTNNEITAIPKMTAVFYASDSFSSSLVALSLKFALLLPAKLFWIKAVSNRSILAVENALLDDS